MPSVDARTGIELIYREECVRLLATEDVGRLAVIEGGLSPLIVPVNYVLDGDTIVFRTDLGTKLQGATRAAVAFEVDRLDRATQSRWSVVARGLADEVTASDERLQERLAALPLQPWAPGDKPHLVRIRTSTLMGRRIRPRDSG